MKDLIIASLIIAVLLGGWILVLHGAERESQQLISSIQEDIIPLADAGNWKQANIQINKLNQDWHDFRKKALYFFHTETINTIDYSMARSLKYAEAEDDSNTAGELNSMIEQLSFLTGNEKLTLQNLF